MDVHYLYGGQQFVWDAEKAATNRRKHGVSFEQACEAFFDEWSGYVDASGAEEKRSAVIGFSVSSKLLYVVHILREDEIIRIISARSADDRERKIYEDG